MRRQTVDVLDDATDVERQMDWMLFANEQDRRHYKYPEVWVPGDPIHARPIFEMGGQWIRPMAQELELHQFNNRDALYPWIRCEDCEVYWSGPDPCWVCGVSTPDKYDWSPKQIFAENIRAGYVAFDVETFEGSDIDLFTGGNMLEVRTISHYPVPESLQRQMAVYMRYLADDARLVQQLVVQSFRPARRAGRTSFQERMQESFARFAEGMQLPEEILNPGAHLSIPDYNDRSWLEVLDGQPIVVFDEGEEPFSLHPELFLTEQEPVVPDLPEDFQVETNITRNIPMPDRIETSATERLRQHIENGDVHIHTQFSDFIRDNYRRR